MARTLHKSASFFSLLTLSLIALLNSALSSAVLAATGPASSRLKFIKGDAASGLKEYRLNSNGLKVLLQEKHSSPVVTVMVAYKVGSRNEAVGYTGSTHFLEHMMFKGTAKHDPLKGNGLDDLLKPIGGENNANTSYDLTNYYEIVPSKNLAVCLELDADRMRHALLRDSDRQSEMTVVRNELELGENTASEILNDQVFATAFREHPYHHPVIGWRSDVEGVPTARLRQFYNDFYYPNNATLIIIGDFNTASTLSLIDKYFSRVPKSPKPFPPVYTTEPPQEGERRFIVQKGEELPKLELAFHIPDAKNKDTFPLEVLASALGDQRRQSSRLYKKLVDTGLASDTNAFNHSMRDPGLFTVYASATHGSKLESIEKVIEDELHLLGQSQLTPAELERAKTSVWKKLRLQFDDPQYACELLADAEAIADWKWLLDSEKNIKAVSAADVQRVAQKYFAASNRTVGYYLPKNTGEEHKVKSGSASAGQVKLAEHAPSSLIANTTEKPKNSPAEQSKSEQAKSVIADPLSKQPVIKRASALLPVPKSAAMANKVQKKILANGMTVLVMPVHGSGIVALSCKIKGGESASPGKTMAASLLAEMLNKGSHTFSKDVVAEQLELMGSSFEPQSQNFWTDFDAETVKEDIDKYMQLVSDALRAPRLEKEELEKLKKLKLSQLKESMADTAELAYNKLVSSIYDPGCIYYQEPFAKQIDEVNSLRIEDLEHLHKTNYCGSNMVLALVGDLTAEQGFNLAEKYFGNWQKGELAKMSVSTCKCKDSERGKVILSNLPEKSSLDIYMAYPADVCIKSKDFCASQIANAALGHDTISSRLAELRNKHGLTYGISSSFSENARPMAPWMVEFSVNPENAARAMKLVKGIINKYVSGGISPEELKVEKQRIAGEYVVHRLRTAKNIADALTKYGALDLGPDFIDKYPGMLNQVTLKEANSVISRFMKLDNLTTSMAGTIPAIMKDSKP